MAHLFKSPVALLETAFAGAVSKRNNVVNQFVRESSAFFQQQHQQHWLAIAVLAAVAILLLLHAAYTRTRDRGDHFSRVAPTAVTALILAAMAYISKICFGDYKYFNTTDPTSIRLTAVGVLFLQLVVRLILDYRRACGRAGGDGDGGGFSGGPVVLFGSAFGGDYARRHGQRYRRWRRLRDDSGNSSSSSSAPSPENERIQRGVGTYPASLPAGSDVDDRRSRRGGGAHPRDPPPPSDASNSTGSLTPPLLPPLGEGRGRGDRPTTQKDIIRRGEGAAGTRDAVREPAAQGSPVANPEPLLSAERRKWRQRVLRGKGGSGSGGSYYGIWTKKQSLGGSGSGKGAPSGGTEGVRAEGDGLTAAASAPDPTSKTGRRPFALPDWCRNLLGIDNHTGVNPTPPPQPSTDSTANTSSTRLTPPRPPGKSGGEPDHSKAASGEVVATGGLPEGNKNKNGKRKRTEKDQEKEKERKNAAPSQASRGTLLAGVVTAPQEIGTPIPTGTGVDARPGVQRASKAKRQRRKETEKNVREGDDKCND